MYVHEELFQKEQITSFKGWPSSIMGKLTNWKKLRKKYGDTPTPEQDEELRKKSAELADLSMDFIETDLPEENLENQNTMTDDQKQKLTDAKQRAAQAKTEKNWKAAIAAYKEGLAIDETDEECKQGIPECETLEAQQATDMENERIEANYRALVASGDEAFGRRDWATAKAAYNNAIGIKAGDPHCTDQLAKITAEETADTAKADADKEQKAKDGRATGVLFRGIF